MRFVRLSLAAMATRFELVLYGDDSGRLRAAGEEALREIERLDAQLSFYRPDSEIRWINARAASGPVRVEPRLFRLLQRCADLNALTDGAFEITIGPLMRAWRFSTPVSGTDQLPDMAEWKAARCLVGMNHVLFDEASCAIQFTRAGVEIDLGAYGKGYAIERAATILKDNGISSAFLHGGTSSVSAIGAPPQSNGWPVALQDPFQRRVVRLAESALSVSAIHGKSFLVHGRRYGHVIDPCSGEPVSRTLAAAIIGPSASDCEALSTALLVLGRAWLPALTERFRGYTGYLAGPPAPKLSSTVEHTF